ncbi:MAG: SMP-30/gluconolactonase/LRE family protein [Sphingomonadaceae bacterium]
MAWEFELIAGPFSGPVGGLAWDGKTILFSVVSEGRILRYDPGDGSTSLFRKYTYRVNGLTFSPEGNLYGCQSGTRRIVRFNTDGSTSPMEQRLDGRIHNHPNDLVCDRKGRIWFTDPYSPIPTIGPQMHEPLEHASVLRLARGHDHWHVNRMTFDTTNPRGILFSKDEKTLYVSESSEEPEGKRELRAYQVREDGTLGPYDVLVSFGCDHRGPHRGVEGMCLDEEGNIIACAGRSGRGAGPMIYVITPSGQILESHPVPADLPMNCTFGGEDLGTLYVSAGEDMVAGRGYLLRVRNTGRRGWCPYPLSRPLIG